MGLVEAFGIPAHFRVAIENDEVGIFCACGLGVGGGLFKAGLKGVFKALVLNLELDDDFLDGTVKALIGGGPGDEKIGAAAAKAVFAVDSPAAIDHPLEKSLKEELRAGFFVIKAFDPAL